MRDNNNSSAVFDGYTAGGTGSYKYRMYVDGDNAFCIQPGVPLKTGNTLKKNSSQTWNALSASQKKAVGLALLYGYQGNRSSLSGSDDEKWLATQTLVWEFVTGCRESTGAYQQTSQKAYSLHFGSNYPKNRSRKKRMRTTAVRAARTSVVFKFPPALASTHTALVLKEPKTKTSIRKIFLPKTVAEMLADRREEIENYKALFGDEYLDFNLVFASSCGRPIEGQVINRALGKLIKDHDLPPVVFHSFRHSSITYKLKLNGGDMKSVQGDSGHAQVKMVADVYSHIIDEDRRLNAQRFEEQFYQSKPIPEVEEPEETTEPEETQTEQELVQKLLANPEMAALLKSLAKNF